MAGIWRGVRSSNILAAAYDAAEQRLLVRFKSGATYAYSYVPQDVADGLVTAPSAGVYLNTVIKDVYPYEQV